MDPLLEHNELQKLRRIKKKKIRIPNKSLEEKYSSLTGVGPPQTVLRNATYGQPAWSSLASYSPKSFPATASPGVRTDSSSGPKNSKISSRVPLGCGEKTSSNEKEGYWSGGVHYSHKTRKPDRKKKKKKTKKYAMEKQSAVEFINGMIDECFSRGITKEDAVKCMTKLAETNPQVKQAIMAASGKFEAVRGEE